MPDTPQKQTLLQYVDKSVSTPMKSQIVQRCVIEIFKTKKNLKPQNSCGWFDFKDQIQVSSTLSRLIHFSLLLFDC